MYKEPKIITEDKSLGDLTISFEGEKYDGEILDTKVTINGVTLCWISWPNKDEFYNKLSNAVEEHRI